MRFQCQNIVQLPDICIDHQDKEFPPIDKLYYLRLTNIDPKRIDRCSFFLAWKITESNNMVFCDDIHINDPRLKAQYLSFPDIFQRILKCLEECVITQSQIGKCDHKDLYIGNEVSKYELPADFLSFVSQVETWKQALAAYENKYWRYGPSVQDGYYIRPVQASDIVCPTDYGGDRISIRDAMLYERKLYFKVEERPPAIEDNCIFWTLEDKKIKVVLFHIDSSEAIAEYYGYLDRYLAVKEKKEAEEKRIKEDRKKWEQERREKQEAEIAAQAKALEAEILGEANDSKTEKDK